MNNIILDVVKQSYNKPYISLSDDMYQAISDLKKFNYENIYAKAMDTQTRKLYKDMFYTLFGVYEKAIDTHDIQNDIFVIFLNGMSKYYLENTTKQQMIIDYLSGMTDNFIKRQYEKYK